MHKKFFGVMYAINIIMQAVFSLLTPAALLFALSFLFVKKFGAPTWIYAVAIALGIILGLISMVKFVITASEGLQRLENQQRKNKTGHNTDEK